MEREKVVKCQKKLDKEKEAWFMAMDGCCKQYCLQNVNKKVIVYSRMGMECINRNGIRDFVLNYLIWNAIMSKNHSHGLPPIVKKT